MRKFIASVICVSALMLCQGISHSQAAPPQRVLQATLTSGQPSYTEDGPQVELTFAVRNAGPQPINPNFHASRLFINDREIKEWSNIVGTGVYGAFGMSYRELPSPILQVGQSSGFSFGYPELGRYFKGVGTYRLRWVSDLFQVPEFTLRILPDQPAKGQEPTTTTLLRLIRAQLPPGWAAFYVDKRWGRGTFEVLRQEEVGMRPRPMSIDNLGNRDSPGPGEAKIQQMQFTLDLEIVPFVSPSQHMQFKADNEANHKKILTLEQGMRHIRRRMAKYDPQTEEEKKQVEAYKKLEREYHALPKFYFHDISLGFDYFGDAYANRDQDKYVEVVDPRARQECFEVTQRLLNLLSRYEPATPEETTYMEPEADNRAR